MCRSSRSPAIWEAMDVTDRITKRLRVYGIVQGVGFRPTVSRHAMETGVTGTVCNKGPYVEIFVQGTPEQVEAFQTALETRPPRRAAILKIDAKPAPVELSLMKVALE